ncbi:hypothetical protein MTO96_028085 [Rhipicephalus appendiculatus]
MPSSPPVALQPLFRHQQRRAHYRNRRRQWDLPQAVRIGSLTWLPSALPFCLLRMGQPWFKLTRALTPSTKLFPMPLGASSESSKSLEDRASGFGGSGAPGPVASKLAMALFLTLVVGSLLCLLSFAIFVFTAMQRDHTDNSDATAQLTDFTDLEGPPTSVHIATSVTVPPTSLAEKKTSDLHLERIALVNRPDDEGSDEQSFNASATPIA